MNYYKRHIGDYAAKAGHLSILEHGVYTLLLDAYYNREQPPTKAEAIRWARARNPEETQAVSDVLAEFFTETDGRYVQARVEEELTAAKAIAERNQLNGKLGGRPPRGRKTQSVKSGLPEERQSTNPLIHESSIKATSSAKTEDCPHAEVIELYHELLPASPRVKVWNETRKANLRTRWREDPKRQSLDYWRRLFAYIGQSEFLTGKVNGHDRRPFMVSLDWIVKPENFAKIIEKKYHHDA